MKQPSLALQVILVLLGAFFALASTRTEEWVVRDSDDTWIAANIFEGQTGFPQNGVIDLNIGYSDFATDSTVVGRADVPLFDDDVLYSGGDDEGMNRAVTALGLVSLQCLSDGTQVAMDMEIRERTTRLSPRALLHADTIYRLVFNSLDSRSSVHRPVPSSIQFSTASIIRLLDVWQNNQSTILTFSAPLKETSISISSASIDFLWSQNSQFYSIAKDTNPADYDYEVQDNLVMITSLQFLRSFPTWLRLGPAIQGANNETLDPGTVIADDEYETESGLIVSYNSETQMAVSPIEWNQLDACVVRPDVPEPCITVETQLLIDNAAFDDRW